MATWGSLQWAPKWAIALEQGLPNDGQFLNAKEYTSIVLATGAILGTIVAALLGGWLGRRITYFGLHRFLRVSCLHVSGKRKLSDETRQ